LPTLKPSLWTVASSVVPCVLRCSECQTEFDLGPGGRESLTKMKIGQINQLFALHCKWAHPDSFSVVGLENPT